MKCPHCSCSSQREITLGAYGASRSYLECEHCGNLWSPYQEHFYMNCPKCAKSPGGDIFLTGDDKLPTILCHDCGMPWVVLDTKKRLPG
ncbi:hypothetical protein Gmet_3654 [Geobacter metallireducens GS-15]|uniref:Uncharacterized protein n=1 Tax=Geobacter metallireducens (strain ATCC 53774 / DSM 7210 / GS-15) TaxID=269799 RepID=J7LYG8_GEOMG|nr:hypothetical protein Gmet_3654 [Geobacter metallireducens GS-15]